jgi:hypothetical protein
MESERRKFGMVLTFAVLFATLALSVSIGCASGTPPEEEWDKTFGGTDDDAGGCDFWLVKADANGSKQWSKTFGGAGFDTAMSAQQTTDGGYILAGFKQDMFLGDLDFWLVKTDSNGNKQWSKTFGGAGNDVAASVQQTNDSGYILAGYKTYVTGYQDQDVWLVKTDSNGSKQWSKTFGGAGNDVAASVQQTSDGGYILAGETESYGVGGDDFWLIKVRTEQEEQ